MYLIKVQKTVVKYVASCKNVNDHYVKKEE
jgi:hypothetical protein